MFGLIRESTVAKRLRDIEDEVAGLGAQLSDLDEAIRDLRKPVKDIVVEWDDYYEKFRALYARIAKRQERAEKAEKAEAVEPNGAVPGDINPLALELLKGISK